MVEGKCAMKCPVCQSEIDAIPLSKFRKSGKKGGKAKSDAKAEAARQNARKERKK
jgi:hypothetical protein